MSLRWFLYPLSVAALITTSGCGLLGLGAPDYQASSEASESYESYYQAFAAREFGSVYDLLSSKSKRSFQQALEAKNEDILHGLDPQMLKSMKPRDAFAAIFGAIHEQNPYDFDDAARSKLIPPPLILGDFRLFRRRHPSGRESQIRLFLEGETWLVDQEFGVVEQPEAKP
ncbi:MAG: hypothetical protein AAF581_12375 [Planctomycetota bacterium]